MVSPTEVAEVIAELPEHLQRIIKGIPQNHIEIFEKFMEDKYMPSLKRYLHVLIYDRVKYEFGTPINTIYNEMNIPQRQRNGYQSRKQDLIEFGIPFDYGPNAKQHRHEVLKNAISKQAQQFLQNLMINDIIDSELYNVISPGIDEYLDVFYRAIYVSKFKKSEIFTYTLFHVYSPDSLKEVLDRMVKANKIQLMDQSRWVRRVTAVVNRIEDTIHSVHLGSLPSQSLVNSEEHANA